MKNPTVLSTTENKSDQDSSESCAIDSDLSNISPIKDVKSDSDCFIAENPSTSVLALLDQTPIRKSKY